VIKEQYKTKDLIDPNDVITNFNDKKKKIRKNIYTVFPKVKRWANIATMISIPISVFGVATGNILNLNSLKKKFRNFLIGQKRNADIIIRM